MIRTGLLAAALALAAAPVLGQCALWVDFALRSAALSPEAQTVLARAARAYPGSDYRIAAHTDAPVTEFLNQIVSQKRGAAVAGFLEAQGVTNIRLLPTLPSDLKGATQAPEALPRRTKIQVSPCSEAELGGA